MAAQFSTRSVDGLIVRLARRQHGAVARWQLLAAGVTRNRIATRLRTGRLTEIHRGVYLVGAVPGPHTHEAAALLACGPGSTLSHRSAAALWRLLPHPAAAPVWITTPPERNATRPRIKVIRAHLDPSDLRRREGMPLTSPPRTLLDLASLLDESDLEHVVAEAHYRKLASDAELRDQLARNPGARGTATLGAVIDLPGGPQRTRSPAERELLRLLRRGAITGFETNAKIIGYEVDFLWREAGLVVEVDGWSGHSGRIAFERDRLKAARLSAAGLRVVPITGRQVRREPAETLERIATTLAATRRRSWSGR